MSPLLLAAIAGCLSSPAEPAGTVPVAGAWQYWGTAESGASATVTGTLALSGVSAVRYQGTATLVETGADGVASRVTGPVTGRLLDGGVMDFTAVVGGVPRTHVGTLRGDTITGRWFVVEAAGMVAGGGRFEAVRR
ncbi:MAG: hypothetical protein KJT01_02925 [Gemmatimonadetes bacterium]|nr:hypothetical protein [Gemmatimonadota bacterium]